MLIDPKEIIDLLRRNLQEQYRFDGGRTLLRELLQNADDAESTSVKIISLPGWPDADHPLLRVPGLLLANDGVFDVKARQGMDKFGGSLKATDKTAVGRFGLGQKSVFHICDAFIVVSQGHIPVVTPFVVNPFTAIGKPGDNCQAWDVAPSDIDCERLLAAGLDTAPQQMVQWFPLRRTDLRPKSTSAGFLSDCYNMSLLSKSADHFWLSSIVAMLRNIHWLEVVGPEGQITLVDRKSSPRLHFRENEPGEFPFGGTLGGACQSAGREVMASGDFGKVLIDSQDWPEIRNRDTDEMEKQKALPHGAVVLVVDPEGPGQLEVIWSVFLPVEDEVSIPLATSGTVKILLHGYFFVDSGRNRVIDRGPAMAFEGNQKIEADWNQLVRSDLVLPMLPAVFHDALRNSVVTQVKLSEVVAHLNSTAFVFKHRASISSKNVLARTLFEGKIDWRLHDVKLQFRPLPQSDTARLPRVLELIPDLVEHMSNMDLVPTIGSDAVLAPVSAEWKEEELAKVVGLLGPNVFQQGGNLARLVEFLDFARDGVSRQGTALQEPVLSLLRQAMIDTKSVMADSETIRNVLKHLPAGCLFSMPASAMEKRTLRAALAAVADTPLCVSAAWLPEIHSPFPIDLDTARALLTALQPLLKASETEEAAAAAAVTILKALGSHFGDAIADTEFCRLNVLRVDKGFGAPTLASLSDLVRASRAGRLFKMSPKTQKLVRLLEDAAPGCNATIINSNEVAKLVGELGEDLAFADDPKMETARMAGEALDHGSDSARSALLDAVWDEDPRYRPWLRVIVAGTNDARQENRELVWITGKNATLDEFVRRLLGKDEKSILLSSSILSTLPDDKQAQLGIKRLGEKLLGKTLVEHRGYIARQPVAPELLAEFFSVGIPDDDLRELPLFVTSTGTQVSAAAGYRLSGGWELPDCLRKIVPIIQAPFGINANLRFESLTREWSREAQLEFLLEQAEPHKNAAEIVDSLSQQMPEQVIQKLKLKPWLTTANDEPVSASDVLDLPGGLTGKAAPHGVDQIVALADLREGLLHESDVALLKKLRVLPNGMASRDRLIEKLQENNVVTWFGDSAKNVANPLQSLARAETLIGLNGWSFLSFLLSEDGANPVSILNSLPPAPNPQVEDLQTWLRDLARIAEAGSTDARSAYNSAFHFLAGLKSKQVNEILSGTRVPTETGHWKSASEVVGCGGSISKQHCLDSELAAHLPHSLSHAGQGAVGKTRRARDVSELTIEQSASSFGKIIEYAQPAVPAELIAVLATMLGGQDIAWRGVVESRLSLGASQVEAIYERYQKEVASTYQLNFGETLEARRSNMRILFSSQEAVSGFAEVETLSGEIRDLPVGDVEPLDVVGQISVGWFTDNAGIRRRGLDIACPLGVEVTDQHVRKLCSQLADEFIGREKVQPDSRRSFDALLEAYARIEEHTAEAVQAELKDQLPGILRALKPAPGSQLRKARDHYDHEIQRAGTEFETRRASLKDDLWAKVNCSNGQTELLERVRSKTEEQGYSPSRMFFELFQNADDAWVQLPASDSLPGKFSIERTGQKTTVRHWGRLINDVGPDIQKGEAKGWRNDLYNMLVLNLSDKEADGPTTGRFGLGFKSVHLLAKEVRIASRYVACHVRGGMLPEPWFEGRAQSFEEKRNYGRPATIIEMDLDEADLAFDSAWTAFRNCARWLPAMSRGIRSIELMHGSRVEAYDAAFEPTGHDRVRILSMSGSARGKAIVLDLDEETTLFLPLGPKGPVAPAADTRGLWLLTPLEEDVRPKWLLNSRTFRVDPGRGRLAGDAKERGDLFGQLGEKLGLRLQDLANLVASDWEGFSKSVCLGMPEGSDATTDFWTSLADAFIGDLEIPLLKTLHIDDLEGSNTDYARRSEDNTRRGWASFVCSHKTFPTRLPSPFSPLVRAVSVRWQLSGLLADEGLWSLLNTFPFVSEVLEKSVSEEAGGILERIGLGRPARLDGGDFFELAMQAQSRIEPSTASWLGMALEEERRKSLPRDEMDRILAALRKAEFKMLDGTWGKAALMPRNRMDATEEEKRIVAMAPDHEILSPDYGELAQELYKVAQAGGRLGSLVTARSFVSWARQCNSIERQKAMMAYLVHGERRQDFAEELRQSWPHWLPRNFDDLCESEFAEGFTPSELKREVLPDLYEKEHLARLDTSPVSIDFRSEYEMPSLQAPSDEKSVLVGLYEWWEQNGRQSASLYDFHTWPTGSNPRKLIDKTAEEDPEGWFSFFALGVFFTIGRTSPQATRNFIKTAQSEGWWHEMSRVYWTGGHKAWSDRLDEIAMTDGRASGYPQWRRMLADLYVVARWLPEYVDVFTNLPRYVEQNGAIRLSNMWWPSAAPELQRRGTEGASLVQSLGIGANWMIREAVRSGFWGDAGKTMHPYGWVNNNRMGDFGQSLGWSLPDRGEGMDASIEVFDRFFSVLGARASFCGDLGLPIQLIMSDQFSADRSCIFKTEIAPVIDPDGN